MNVNLIVAIDSNCFGIGKNGTIPWINKADMKWFKRVTVGDGNNAVVMGRTTYESIGKPLPNRLNIVLSNTVSELPGCFVTNTLENAIQIAKENKVDSLFIIGGGKVYKDALEKELVDILYIDKINTSNTESDYDTFFNYNEVINSGSWSAAPILLNCNFDTNLNTEVYYNIKNTKCRTDEKYCE